MLKSGFVAAVLFVGAISGPVEAASIDGQESYDLLFRQGTLDSFDKKNELVYQRDVTSVLNPQAEERDTGKVVIGFDAEDSALARIQFRQGEKRRGLGIFPASVGNPMIMYFYESVIRDMAETAGGSPFYIRNRVKEALVQPSEMETGQAVFNGKTIQTTKIDLYPFAEDPNRGRMGGFGELVLSVTMSEDVPGWYLSLVAEANGSDGPIYRSMMLLDGVEQKQ